MVGAAILEDPRFEVPIYTTSEAARYLDVKPSTFSGWVKGYTHQWPNRPATVGAPILTTLPADEGATKRSPTIPFVGLVEGMVLAAIRASGVPMQRIRPALYELQREMGLAHALASKKLYTDGAEVLFDVAERSDDRQEKAAVERMLVVVRNGQHVFTEVVQEYLQRIEYATDGFADIVHLPAYERGGVVVDARRSFGKPIFKSGGARVSDVLERFWVGESIDELTDEFGLRQEDLEDALRVASRRAV